MPTSRDVLLQPPRPEEHECEVLVVGSGPSGASASYWLASRGIDVLCVEKKHFPRQKTCGDGLTPRAVKQLRDMGLEEEVAAGSHRYIGLRSVAFGRELEMPWPDHPEFPSYGYTITRHDLDAMVASHAEKAGAVLWQGAEALEPLGARESAGDGASGRNGGHPSAGVRAGGAVVRDVERGTTTRVRARYTIVADGSLSRFGRALGSTRDKSYPQGMAIRGYFASPRHDEPYIESHLDIRDRDGAVVPGYGWIFPLGDGRVNVGVGLLSTENRWKGMNTTKLMEEFVCFAPKSWCLSPKTSLGEPTGGRLPMGLAVGPRVGADYLLVGDAAGVINPFNGEGIAYGWETGRLAAEVVARGIEAGHDSVLSDYERRLEADLADYYRVARGFVRAIANPRLMRATVGAGMLVPPVMRGVLRIMANLCRPDGHGPPELTYRLLLKVASEIADRRQLTGAPPATAAMPATTAAEAPAN